MKFMEGASADFAVSFCAPPQRIVLAAVIHLVQDADLRTGKTSRVHRWFLDRRKGKQMDELKRCSRGLTWATALLLVASAAGCGGRDPVLGTGVAPLAPPAPPATALALTVVSPLDNATGVATNTKTISATFNQAMDPATLTASSFTLACPAGAPVTGAVTSSANVATLTLPAAPDLPSNTVCTATVTSAAKDTAGVALASPFVWKFTTAPDTTPPTVLTVDPVAPNPAACLTKAVNATFSEAMDPATINSPALTFAVKLTGGADVPGTVAYDVPTRVASFKATGGLSAGDYTATITTAAKDLAGNALAADKTWTFSADGSTCVPPPVAPVNLGAAARFGIAATKGVTNTPGAPITQINGDVVLATLSTCNAVQVDNVGGFGLCGGSPPTISGQVITPTFPDTTTANAVRDALRAAYLAITPPAGPPAAGSLGNATAIPAGSTLGAPAGNALVQGDNLFTPGVYQSITSILITGELTLDAQNDPNATFIFQSSSTVGSADGSVGTPTRILLVNGAKASNVFWQAGTSATLGTNSVWQGNILASEDVTMKTGASSCGRLFAGAFSDGAFIFDQNVVSVPGNASAPATCK
jgi:hypothetical protein